MTARDLEDYRKAKAQRPKNEAAARRQLASARRHAAEAAAAMGRRPVR
ncbi:hypothetical protein [Streptomyces sp. DH37]|nr:hypothetical protein [Streptomyces sp. DH37]MDG9703773.1 hypothetical protein [Streptomyces sp. DH37]